MPKTKTQMDMVKSSFLLPLLAVAVAGVSYHVKTDVPHQPGWIILRDNFTIEHAKQIMVEATDDVWTLLGLSAAAKAKFFHVDLIVREIAWRGQKEIGSTMDNHIYVPAEYIQHLWEQERKAMDGNMRLLIYHHMTHVWQWTGSCCTHDPVTEGLVEGIADYVPTVAHSVALYNNCGTDRWTPLATPHWYDGWCQTALFLVFCTKQNESFVEDLNGEMEERNLFHESFFTQLLHSKPDELWAAYVKQSSLAAAA